VTDAYLIQSILTFWFDELDEDGMCRREQQKLWYNPPNGTDEAIRERFGRGVETALAGALDHWAESSTGLVALVILLDQLTRNIYRGTPAAFSGDEKALALARAAVEAGRDRSLPAMHRVFLYTPFEHAEDLAAQQKGVQLFARLLEDVPPGARERIADFQRYMIAHRDVIEAFGRFPHRNTILGRASTPEELAHLETHGGF
jgi:uncharacterized protein (DUF924 family)